MDVREKLVEIIKECEREYENFVNKTSFMPNKAEFVADHLIAHGVTVQECGHWVYDFNLAGSNFYRCSVCDRQETLLEKEDIYEYCPFFHCGAKMMPQPPKGE